MESNKENIIKTAFDIYCNMVYGRQYPFTVNNLRIFFSEITFDFIDYIGLSKNSICFDFDDNVLQQLIVSAEILRGSYAIDYMNHFIKQYQLSI